MIFGFHDPGTPKWTMLVVANMMNIDHPAIFVGHTPNGVRQQYLGKSVCISYYIWKVIKFMIPGIVIA